MTASARYTSLDRVEHHTGRTFTDAQRAECVLQIPVAEAWVDGYTGRTWGVTAAVTGERHVLRAGEYGGRPLLVWLTKRPIASVQSVSVRPAVLGADATVLVADETYEVLDATSGLLAVTSGYDGYVATVAYTPAVPVDPRVELAATMLCAAWLDPTFVGATGATAGTTSMQVGDVRLTYNQPTAGASAATATAGRLGIPVEVTALLRDLRGMGFA